MRLLYHAGGWARWALLMALGCGVARSCPGQDQVAVSPDEDLPPHITRLTRFGERADWSHDGRRVLFVEKTFGDAYEIDLGTRMPRLLTGHYPHLGYTRALYLANGDILLSGPEQFDPKDPGPSRVQCFLYVLDKSGTQPPVPLGTKCSEGPAVSRRRMHIAWTHVAAQYPDEMPPGSSRITEADIVYEGGIPKLANQRLVLDSRALPFRCTLETQNFRPPDERELTFSAYGHNGTDVCGVDLETRKVTNYSRAPDQYDEPEGIFPDGRWTCVESDRESTTGRGMRSVDIWKLALDGSGRMERLPYFNEYPGYKASNPVISDDGRSMAFQMARSKDPAGVGYGIFLYDLSRLDTRHAAASPLADIGPAPPTALIDSAGDPFALDSLRGKAVLVSFIYTTCSGSCPATTLTLSRVQQKLEEAHLWGDRVEFVSISLDPTHDPPEVLADYARTYGVDSPSWHFLTGPPDQVARVIAAWGMWAKIGPSGVLDHPSRIFLLDPRGHQREIYNLQFLKPETVVQDVQTVLAE